MNFDDTLKSVDLVLATGEVPLIIGESGIGKTALAKELASKNNWSLVVINGNLLKEGEIGGLPTVESYTVPPWDNPNSESVGSLHPDGEDSPKDSPNDSPMDFSSSFSNSIQVNPNSSLSHVRGTRASKKKTTVYAVHHKLREIDEETARGRTVLLFIDEINRCEHAVQQELMNLILNREINGYNLPAGVKILAAMNPSSKYGTDFDYQVVDMDAAQENRFVWLNMEPDHKQWINWAISAGIEPKVIEFISTFPEYLHKINEDDLRATPRSYERISKIYSIYKNSKDTFSPAIFHNVVKGNVGRVIAQEFINFVEKDHKPLISYEDVFESGFGENFKDGSMDGALPQALAERIKEESHTRLYLSARNILQTLEMEMRKLAEDASSIKSLISRLVSFLKLYPVDLMIAIMKDIRNNYPAIYKEAIENEAFVDSYFEAYSSIS